MKNHYLKIHLISGIQLNFVISEEETHAFVRNLKKGGEWIGIGSKKSEATTLRSNAIIGYNIGWPKSEVSKGNTIPIKSLAGIFHISPITITRNFAHTLEATGKLRRATLKTALELRDHLKKSGRDENIPTETELKNLFKDD